MNTCVKDVLCVLGVKIGQNLLKSMFIICCTLILFIVLTEGQSGCYCLS